MDRNLALQKVKLQLTEERYEHTVRVTHTAIVLAKQFGADVRQAELAAIFHDYAKMRPVEEMKQIMMREKMPPDLFDFHHELWHAPVGAYLVAKELGITDEAVLLAITYHTTGRAGMTLLEKIVYLADYMEPGRDFPGVADVREIAQSSLDEALFRAIQQSILYLVQKRRPIYPDTLRAYNDFI